MFMARRGRYAGLAHILSISPRRQISVGKCRRVATFLYTRRRKAPTVVRRRTKATADYLPAHNHVMHTPDFRHVSSASNAPRQEVDVLRTAIGTRGPRFGASLFI